LPGIFQGTDGDPVGSLRQLVGVLETTTQGIDAKISRIGAAIDPDTSPRDWLNYLARWLDLPWDDALPERAKRCLLRHVDELLGRRGTRRGLERLLRCLMGKESSWTVADLTVDYPPLRIGGRNCRGGSLPALLAGASSRVAILGGKAVLGRASLACAPDDCDPLRQLAPTVKIAVRGDRETRDQIQPLIGDVLAQYLPAGLRLLVAWKSSVDDPDGEVVDAEGPGALNVDSSIGRTLLFGRSPGRIGEEGLEMGFSLQ
jgi:phage tail-like protein